MLMYRPKFGVIIKQNCLILGILLCIFLAEIAPWIGARGGPLVPEITVKYLAVSIIFFISGLTLKTEDLTQASKLTKVHVFIQVFSFIVTPVIMQIFVFVFVMPFSLNEWIVKGIVTVGCMPPPISSAVILTKSVGGNEAAAIFNSALGSLLGIILTPVLLLVYVGLASTLPVVSTIVNLTQTIIFPLLIGQLSQVTISEKFRSWLPTSCCSQLALLFIIYTSFCDMFAQKDFNIEAHHVLITLLLVVVIQLMLMYSSFHLSVALSRGRNVYAAEDIIAIVFCSTHKSLTLGLPLLKTLYGGYAHLSQISLPLLVYHPVQLILGGLIVPQAQQWLKRHSSCSDGAGVPALVAD